MKYFSGISIPNPCHENWEEMTTAEKGKFCNKCAKNVIDFTNMPQQEITNYLLKNRNEKVCGRFKKEQLEDISLKIPAEIFNNTYSFRKTFMLILLIVMGGTFFSCETTTHSRSNVGKVIITDTIQKVDSIVSPISNDTIPIFKIGKTVVSDTVNCLTKPKKETKPIIEEIITSEVVDVTLMGDIEYVEPNPPTINITLVEKAPEFINSNITQNTNKTAAKLFIENIIQFYDEHLNKELLQRAFKDYNTTHQRVYAEFIVDTIGNINLKQVRTNNPILENYTKEVCKLLPQVKPGENNHKKIVVSFRCPFVIIRDKL